MMKYDTRLQKRLKLKNLLKSIFIGAFSFLIIEILFIAFNVKLLLFFTNIKLDISNAFWSIVDMIPFFDLTTWYSWHAHTNDYNLFFASIKNAAIYYLPFSLFFAVLIAILFCSLLNKIIKIKTNDNTLRGSQVSTINGLKKRILKYGASCYQIADINIPCDYQYRNFMFAGSPGSGKTVQFKDILSQVRCNGKPFLIYDAKPEYVANFYFSEETKNKNGVTIPPDIIICPFDKRGVRINLWNDIDNDFDYKRIASIIIPNNPNVKDPHWINSARDIFEDMLRVLHKYKNMKTNKHLYYYSNLCSLDNLKVLLSGTSSFNKLQHNGEAKQIRSSLMNFTRIFKYLSDDGESFSIKKWVQSNPKNGIFLLARDDMNDVLTPLCNYVIDTYFSAILSLPDMQYQPNGKDTEYWTFIDEMTDLGKINKLSHFCKKGRSKGSCVVIGAQDIAQLDSLYGEREAQVLRGLFRTWMIFAMGEEISPKRISDAFGTVEIEEYTKTTSRSKQSKATNNSITSQESAHRKIVNAVLPSEISQLKDLEFFLRFRGGYPIAKGLLKYVTYDEFSPNFILNDAANCQPLVSDDAIDLDVEFINKSKNKSDGKKPKGEINDSVNIDMNIKDQKLKTEVGKI